jgi:hypothetical protein
MKQRTVTVTEGEWLGPVDWDYDFASHGWDRGGACNPDLIPDSIATLRTVEDGLARGERWTIAECGGRYKVVRVGMWDGWPFWRPTPTYLIERVIGCETTSWFGPHDPRKERDGGE